MCLPVGTRSSASIPVSALSKTVVKNVILSLASPSREIECEEKTNEIYFCSVCRI